MPEDGFGGAGGFGGVAAAPAAMAYELRPLSLGEILDRTFSLYRRRFWLYVGLAAVAAAITTLGEFARLTWGLSGSKIAAADGPRAVLVTLATTLGTLLLYLVAYCLTQAATVHAVNAAYLGRETSIGASFATVRRHWLRYIGIVFWQGCSAVWVPVVLAILGAVLLAPKFGLQVLGAIVLVLAGLSFIYVLIAYIRNSLGIVASVVEDLGVARAMRRSKVLVAGRKGSVLALLLLMYVLNLAGGIVQGVLAVFMVMAHGGGRAALEALVLLATFVVGSLVAPVGAIAFCVFYIDQRVRREGYDVELLMEAGGVGGPLAPFGGAAGGSPFSAPPGSPFGTAMGFGGVAPPPPPVGDSPFSRPLGDVSEGGADGGSGTRG